jgi:hypothetical protein
LLITAAAPMTGRIRLPAGSNQQRQMVKLVNFDTFVP